MNIKLLLFSTVALLSYSGITLAQTGPSYNGTFTNTVTNVSGTMTMSTTITQPDSIHITQPDSIHGYINFSGYANQPPACGAGSYKGQIVADSFFLSFSSLDTDSRCGFDYGWPFSVKGRFYRNRDSIAGDYQIANAWREVGFFTLARPSTATATAVASVREEHQPRVYPNPVNRQFVVELPKYSPGVEAIVTDQLGKTVLTKQLTGATTTIDLDVAEGVYFLNIITPETRSIQKIVVSH